MSHDDIQSPPLFLAVVENVCLSKSDDASILESPFAGDIVNPHFVVDIEFHADIVIATDDVELGAFAGAMEIDAVVAESEIDRHDIWNTFVGKTHPANIAFG